MKKRAKRHPTSSFHVLCPFCAFPCLAVTNPFKWCAGCYVQYYETASGQIWFDTELKREEYIWPIALAKSGGARIGGPLKPEQ